MLFLSPCAGGLGSGQEDQENSQERAPGLGLLGLGSSRPREPASVGEGSAGCVLGTRSVSSWSCEATSTLPIRPLFGCPWFSLPNQH